MFYEKLKLKKGEKFRASHVEHIEDGISRLYDAMDKPTDAKFFDIDYDGIISLKPEYRGCPSDETYSHAVSDNGAGVNGSKIDELPEKIVIPEVINGRTVVGFQPGMFHSNYRVKEIVFPASASTIPEAFALEAKYLTSIRNTEHITEVGNKAFRCTRIDKALFPNLTTVGTDAFAYCVYLVHANIGDNITEIPKNMFAGDISLFSIKGGAAVKKVGVAGFANSRSLRVVPFISKITNIGNNGFFGSRIQYDWGSLTGCTFGSNATPVQDNTSVYWTGVDYIPCENPPNTLMNQKNTVWADEKIGEAAYNGVPATFGQGCAFFGVLHIHSAVTGNIYTHPNQLVEEIRGRDGGEAVLQKHPGNYEKDYFEVLGYTCTEIKDTITKDIYKTLCDALARGAYAYVAQSTTGDANGGHGVVIYGINEIGEMLVVDSSTGSDKVDEYNDLFTYTMPFQNFTGPGSDIIIVEKQV